MGMESFGAKRVEDPKKAEEMAHTGNDIREAQIRYKKMGLEKKIVEHTQEFGEVREELAGIVYDLQQQHKDPQLSMEDINKIKEIIKEGKFKFSK